MYGFFIVPAKGLELITGLLAGDTLTITRCMVGKGNPPEDTEPSALTDLFDPVAQATSTTPVVNGRQVKMTVEYRNDMNGGLEHGFDLSEFGIFAQGKDGKEVLIYYDYLGDYPLPMPPYKHGGAPDIRRFPLSIVVNNDLNVTVAYDPQAFLTAKDLIEHTENKENPHGVTAAQVGAIPVVSGEEDGQVLVWRDKQWVAETLSGNDSGGLGPVIRVTTEIGANVTCTNGTITLSKKAEETVVEFSLSAYDTWTIVASMSNDTVSKQIVVTESKLYELSLFFFKATLIVTTESGATVTASNGSDILTEISNGMVTFQLTSGGTYAIQSELSGTKSELKSVEVTQNGETYNTTLDFIVLTVVAPEGATIEVQKGDVTKQGISQGTIKFYLPSTGIWTVTATKGSLSTTSTIDCSSYTSFQASISFYKYYGVKIDTQDSNPETCVTYIGDAVGMGTGEKAWGNTAIFEDIKPCVLRNGSVVYYLQKTNLTTTESGQLATIDNEQFGDVMVEIPKLGYKMTTDGRYHYVYVTNDPNADGYCYRAHSMDAEGDCDKIYIGAYLAYVDESRPGAIYSLSGKKPTGGRIMGTERNRCKQKAKDYELMSFYPLTLLQCLYLIRYKSLDGSTALGKGKTANSNFETCGQCNTLGPDYGETTGTHCMCFLNIENFWAGGSYLIDGILMNTQGYIKTAFRGFNDTAEGYPFSKHSGLSMSSTPSGYMSKIQGTNEGGFLIAKTGGSQTTYFCDWGALDPNQIGVMGEQWYQTGGLLVGPFNLSVSRDIGSTNGDVAVRFVHKHQV